MDFLIVLVGAALFLIICYRWVKTEPPKEEKKNPEGYQPLFISRTLLHGDMVTDMLESFRKDHIERKNQKAKEEKQSDQDDQQADTNGKETPADPENQEEE